MITPISGRPTASAFWICCTIFDVERHEAWGQRLFVAAKAVQTQGERSQKMELGYGWVGNGRELNREEAPTAIPMPNDPLPIPRLRSAGKGVLYFLHIPKTAGSSVTKWLTDRVAQESICPAKNWDQLVMIDPEALPNYQLFAGHFGMDLEPFLERKVTAVTLLRDPLSRTISHYRHVRRDAEHPLHEQVLHQSFEMFVMDKQNWPMIENFQARYLVSTPIAFKQFCKFYDRNVAKRNRLSVLSEDARYLLDPSYVRDKALEAIVNHLEFVGTDERLPDFLHQIGERLAMQTSVSVYDIPRENIAPSDEISEPSAISLEIVESLTKIDKEIYIRAFL